MNGRRGASAELGDTDGIAVANDGDGSLSYSVVMRDLAGS